MSHAAKVPEEPTLTAPNEGASIPFQSPKKLSVATSGRVGSDGDANSSPSVWRRQRTLVNHAHQLRFTSVVLVQMTAVLLAIAWFAYSESQRTMELVLSHLLQFPVTTHELHVANQTFLFSVLLVLGCAALVQVLFGIYASHKLAGPVLKMTRTLARASRGDFSERITFRSGDHLGELPTALNRALEALAADQKRRRRDIDDLERALVNLAEAPTAPEDLAGIADRVTNLTAETPKLEETCGVGRAS